MTELPIPPRPQLPRLASGTLDQPGRNHPGIGRWLCEKYRPARRGTMWVVDPMCGAGQLWCSRPEDVFVVGCEIVLFRVQLARENSVSAIEGRAEEWAPACVPDLVAFSPPYPNCDHSSGSTERQQSLVSARGAQSMQAIEQCPDLLRVFLQIATYRADAPVAVIVRNSIRDQIEVDWASEVAASMVLAGLGEVERFWRAIPPGMTEQWKLSSGKLNCRTGKTHRVIDREWILVARKL